MKKENYGMSKILWQLLYNGKIIYTGIFENEPTCPKSILGRYWPKVAEKPEIIETLKTSPVTDEQTGQRLEWKNCSISASPANPNP